jgi:hypothetical protein
LLIHFKDGTRRYGLIVGLTGGVMRVAVADCEDVSEFHLVKGAWVASDWCEVVSFEFPPGLAQHEDFRAAVTRAVKPIERLPGSPGPADWALGNVN